MRVVLNRGYERQLAASPEMVGALRRAAEHVAGEARQAAPRRAGPLPEGRRRHYADMISAVAGVERGEALARVVALHYTSLWVELGTVNNPPAAPLRRGLDASAGRAL